VDGTHVADLVTANAARVPDQPAVIDVTSANTLMWAELDEAVSAEADRVSAAGAAPGDRVVVRLGNGAAFCVAVLGALRAGAVVVPHGPIAVAPELDVVLADCRPTLVVAAEGDETARACAATVGAAVAPPPDLAARAPARPGVGAGEDIALLVYASGTTGVPRGIRLSHRALLANRAQTAALRPAPVTPVDRVLLSLPLFHSFGLAAGFLQVCWVGATVVLAEQLEPEQIADILVAQRVSALAGVPTMYRGLLDLPAERLRTATAGVRLCTSGGAPLPPEWLAAFQQATGLAIVEGYGLTEAGGVVTTNPLGAPPKPGSVGRALPGVELRLVTADGRPIEPDDEEEEDDGTGLVALRGPNLFSGYWPDGVGGPDAEGWFRTADVGFLDADGDLHLVERSSDVVIVNGFNVYPREVEQVLLAIEGVTEAAVVGQRDERAGEVVKAVLVTDPAAGVDEAAVREFCAQRLARFKVPAVIAFVQALPRTPTGKIARRQLARS
jgi:long-chain acyl-CoA synthetase